MKFYSLIPFDSVSSYCTDCDRHIFLPKMYYRVVSLTYSALRIPYVLSSDPPHRNARNATKLVKVNIFLFIIIAVSHKTRLFYL